MIFEMEKIYIMHICTSSLVVVVNISYTHTVNVVVELVVLNGLYLWFVFLTDGVPQSAFVRVPV